MAKEIEDKYLVISDEYRELAEAEHDIKQGYLSRDPERVVRVRVCDAKAFITIKGVSRGAVRDEFEYPIPLADALYMIDTLCVGNIVEKTRYVVPFGGERWEVDEFHGAKEGLVLAEIEVQSPDYDYPLPPFVGQKVTGNLAYYNSNM